MRKASFLAVLVIFVMLPMFAFADPYDKDFVVTAMRANQARIGVIKTAVANNDFFKAAQAFFDYASLAAKMQTMDPPKNSKEDWLRLWNMFQDRAFLGIGACGERDAAKVLKALDELVAVNKIGHPEFRF
jgi:hypothetical protein